MKKKLLLSLFIVMMGHGALGGHDARALKILQGVQGYYEGLTSFEATFTYGLENVETGMKEVYEGSIAVKGEKYCLTIAGQVFITNGTTHWVYTKDHGEVTVSHYHAEEHGLDLSTIYTLYQQGYRSTYVEGKKIGGAWYDVIELRAKDKGDRITKVRLTVGRTTQQLRSWTLWDGQGTEYKYMIQSFQPNRALEDRNFEWHEEDYEGVTVVDLR